VEVANFPPGKYREVRFCSSKGIPAKLGFFLLEWAQKMKFVFDVVLKAGCSWFLSEALIKVS